MKSTLPISKRRSRGQRDSRRKDAAECEIVLRRENAPALTDGHDLEPLLLLRLLQEADEGNGDA